MEKYLNNLRGKEKITFRESDFTEEGQARIKSLYLDLKKDLERVLENPDERSQAIKRLDKFMTKYETAKKINDYCESLVEKEYNLREKRKLEGLN